MALFHFCVKQIKRSNGHSALAAAAYRSGEKLFDRYYNEVQDYTRKGGVVESMILLPPQVPERLSDRETLWYEVECNEKRKDAQLAYSFDIALQNELTMEENREVLLRFINENLISRGMICDVAIHDPEREEGAERNPHAHILVPMRPINENGEWGPKRKHVPVFDDEGNPVLDKNGKQKIDNPFTTDWGKAETLEEWRKNWDIIVNEKFGEKNLGCHIEHRSNAELGIEDAPQMHEGSAVRRMEKRGIRTYKRSWNAWVKRSNLAMHNVINILRELSEWIKEAREKIRRIENPTITDMVMQYYEHRDEVAEGFERGTKKAKTGNLKLAAEMVAYIQRNNLTDIDSLETLIGKKNEELGAEYKKIQSKKDERAEIRKNLKLVNDYLDNKPVYDEAQKIFFKKRKQAFQDAHRTEINKFNKAKRLLKEMGHEEPDIELVGELWTKRLEALQDEISAETEKINNSDLKQEIKMLSKIREAVDYATKESSGDKGDGIDTEKAEADISVEEKREKADRKSIKENTKEPIKQEPVPVSCQHEEKQKNVIETVKRPVTKPQKKQASEMASEKPISKQSNATKAPARATVPKPDPYQTKRRPDSERVSMKGLLKEKQEIVKANDARNRETSPRSRGQER